MDRPRLAWSLLFCCYMHGKAAVLPRCLLYCTAVWPHLAAAYLERMPGSNTDCNHCAWQVALYAVLPLSGIYLYTYLLKQRRKRLGAGKSE